MQRTDLTEDLSAAENDVFKALDRWARDSHVSFTSLTPQWRSHEEGYDTFECRATATGDQASLGRLLYEIETDPLPARVEECELSTRDAKGAQLALSLRFSFVRINETGRTGNEQETHGQPRNEEPSPRHRGAFRRSALMSAHRRGIDEGLRRFPARADAEHLRSESPRAAHRVRPDAAGVHANESLAYLALTGTMVTDGKALAFFSGSRSEYSRVIGVGDSIADFKVTAITAQQVELERDGKSVVLVVGSGSSRSMAHRSIRAPSKPNTSARPSTASAVPASPRQMAQRPPPAAPAASTDKNEVLRRMMERREQEMSK